MNDRLYGTIDTSKIEDFLVLDGFARLNDVSLSAVPPFLKGYNNSISRYEHSIGAYYLSTLLNEEFDKYKELIGLAGLLHDIASPPFSHLSEPFMKEITGYSHEEFAYNLISSRKVRELVESEGFSAIEICDLINGKGVFGKIINGSIDLDNLDNSLRYGVGLGIINRHVYSPEKIVKKLHFNGDILYFDSSIREEIKQWEKCRITVYNEVYSKNNLYPAAILRKAIQLLREAGKLDSAFFTFTDSKALDFLKSREECSKSMDGLNTGNYTVLKFEMKSYLNLNELRAMEKSYAEKNNLEDWQVCGIQISSNRNRIIDIPFDDGSFHETTSNLPAKSVLLFVRNI